MKPPQQDHQQRQRGGDHKKAGGLLAPSGSIVIPEPAIEIHASEAAIVVPRRSMGSHHPHRHTRATLAIAFACSRARGEQHQEGQDEGDAFHTSITTNPEHHVCWARSFTWNEPPSCSALSRRIRNGSDIAQLLLVIVDRTGLFPKGIALARTPTKDIVTNSGWALRCLGRNASNACGLLSGDLAWHGWCVTCWLGRAPPRTTATCRCRATLR